MARVGVAGVNFHTFPDAGYQLFSFQGAGSTRTAQVYPEYYGLMMFAQAAPPGSRLLSAPGLRPGRVGVWATRDTGGTTESVRSMPRPRARKRSLSAFGARRGPVPWSA